MPKMKTKRAAAKRYSSTGTGKVKIHKAKLRHILTKKSRNQKRRYRKGEMMHGSNMKLVKDCIPYGSY